MTEDAVSLEQSSTDPRPVFEGDWQSASGREKGEHSERVRQWKARHPERTGQGAKAGAAKAQRPMAAGSRPQPSDAQPHADDIAALQAVIDHAPIQSDRIRAIEAKQRILSRVEQEALAEAHGPLVALRDALSAIPEGDRVDALGGLLGVQRAEG